MKINLDPKQLELLKNMLDRFSKALERIAEELKRKNDREEREEV